MIKRVVLFILLVFAIFLIYLKKRARPLPNHHGLVDTRLFLGESEQQKLLVVFGGSEGGLSFSGEKHTEFREEFLNAGFAFLNIAYFGTENTPPIIDRISLDSIMAKVHSYLDHPLISDKDIYLLGVGRGGELALNLASYYQEVNGVIGISSSNVVLPARYGKKETSSWMINGEELPYALAEDSIVQIMKNGDFYEAINRMLDNDESMESGEIPLWNSHADILLMNPDKDETYPSVSMGYRLIRSLKKKYYNHPHRQVIIQGKTADVLKETATMISFLRDDSQ